MMDDSVEGDILSDKMFVYIRYKQQRLITVLSAVGVIQYSIIIILWL